MIVVTILFSTTVMAMLKYNEYTMFSNTTVAINYLKEAQSKILLWYSSHDDFPEDRETYITELTTTPSPAGFASIGLNNVTSISYAKADNVSSLVFPTGSNIVSSVENIVPSWSQDKAAYLRMSLNTCHNTTSGNTQSDWFIVFIKLKTANDIRIYNYVNKATDVCARKYNYTLS